MLNFDVFTIIISDILGVDS